jgi:hypothetical protein
MENEGIMGLPAGQDMQNEAPPSSPSYVSSADSYDAALQGLGIARNDPAQAQAVRRAVRESIAELSLSPTEVSAVLDVLEYMSQNPDQYPELRQRLIDSGMMDPDDLPETYDAAYLGMAIMVLNEYQASRVEGAQAPMQMAPEVENLGPMPMAEGGLANVAQYLASRGRNGDSMLAHITPAEAQLLKQAGGAGTINPETGLREFFLKKLFKGVKKAVKSLLKNPIVRVVATVALATVLGPAGIGVMSSAAAAATASAATTLGAGGNVKDALISAATSYFGAGGTIGGVNPVSSIAKLASKIPGVTEGGKFAQGIGAGVTSAALGKAAGMSTDEALRMGLQQGVMTGYTYDPDPLQEVQVTGRRVATEGAPASTAGNLGSLSEGQLFSMGYTPDEIANIRGAAPGATAPTAGNLAGLSEGQLFSMGYTPDEIANIRGAATTSPAQVATASPGAVPTAQTLVPGKTFTERLKQFGSSPSLETAKNAFLVNPNITEGLGRYVPAGLTLAGLSALDKPTQANEAPLFDRSYGGAEFIRDNPQMFSGNLGRTEGMPPSYNPVVPTPSYTKGTTNIPFRPVPLPRGVPVPLPRGVPVPLPRGVPVPPQGIDALYGYGLPELSPPVEPPVYMAGGGSPTHFPRKTGPINGPGTGTSDSIPAMLSDGEFVFTAKAVRNAGGGSRRKGAKRMYALMKKLEGGAVQG